MLEMAQGDYEDADDEDELAKKVPVKTPDADDDSDFEDLDYLFADAEPKRTRAPAACDRAASIPAGCKMRKYVTANKPPYWHAQLAPGTTDAHGHSNRIRNWNAPGKTEEEVIENIEAWLWENSRP